MCSVCLFLSPYRFGLGAPAGRCSVGGDADDDSVLVEDDDAAVAVVVADAGVAVAEDDCAIIASSFVLTSFHTSMLPFLSASDSSL